MSAATTPATAADDAAGARAARRTRLGATREWLVRHPAWALATTFFTVYSAYSLSLWPQFGPAGFDLGIFDQAVRHYAHFKAPYVALKGPHYNLLGDHFHPILALWAPLYWLWDDPRVLMIGQAALVALSIPVVHAFARRRVPAGAALAWAAGYALGWPLQAMVNFNVHEVAFAVPLLALAVDALDRRLDRRLLICCLLLVLVREDMGVIVAVLGVLRAVAGIRADRDGDPTEPDGPAEANARRRRLGVGLGLVAAGVVAYWFVTSVAIPHFNADHTFAYWDYTALGPDAPSAVVHIVAHPVDTLRLFFTPFTKTRTMLWLLVPLALLPLRSRYSLIALPVLAERFFSGREALWGVGFHYSAVIWPVLVLAALDAAHRSGLTDRTRLSRLLAAWVLAVPVVGTLADQGVFAFHRIVNLEVLDRDQLMADQAAIVAMIPPDVCVEVDDRLAPRLLHTNLVGIPGSLGLDPGLVALDLSQETPGYLEPPTAWVLADYRARGYVPIAERGSVVLLRSPTGDAPSASCGPFGQG